VDGETRIIARAARDFISAADRMVNAEARVIKHRNGSIGQQKAIVAWEKADINYEQKKQRLLGVLEQLT